MQRQLKRKDHFEKIGTAYSYLGRPNVIVKSGEWRLRQTPDYKPPPLPLRLYLYNKHPNKPRSSMHLPLFLLMIGIDKYNVVPQNVRYRIVFS